MEVLNNMISVADVTACCRPFLHRESGTAPPCLQSPTAGDLRCIRAILQLFPDASGLVTNMDKCSISPIRCSEEEVAVVLDAFPGPLAPFPCKYLGIPLTLLKPRRADEQPLIDKVAARIPTWKAGLLNDVGRATLTKVTLSAIPVHVSIASGLSS
jgi:hypothetical protein